MSVITFSKPKPRLGNPKWTEKKDKARDITRRVEMLGSLDDRRNEYLGAGDRGALIELAGEYVLIGCPRRANEIILECDNL